MEAKKQLGRELVARYHGAAAAAAAEGDFNRRFRDNQSPEEIPEVNLPAGGGTVSLGRLLAEAGLVSSNSEGRRAIQQGGVKVNGEKVADEGAELPRTGEYVVQFGKRRFARVKFL
jgi:tyrosyl-tRNA synthetase